MRHRDRLRAAVGGSYSVVALIASGIGLVIGGSLIDDGRTYYPTIASSIVIAGVAMVVLPLLAKQPGRLEAMAPVRLLAWTGPLSYAVLIANEPLRLVASFLRVEGIPWPAWWLYLVLYVPLTLVAAAPLASLLGIARSRSRARRASDVRTAAPEMESPFGLPETQGATL